VDQKIYTDIWWVGFFAGDFNFCCCVCRPFFGFHAMAYCGVLILQFGFLFIKNMALSNTITTPFRKDSSGVIRIGNTRVTFDTVITAFKNGSTSEEIVYQFPSLDLADVYAAIGYYLKNRADSEIYLAGRQKKAKEIQEQQESRYDSQVIDERLSRHRQKKILNQ